MRKIALGAALLGLAAFAAAQTPTYNKFIVFDGSVEYTSRGSLSSNEGELLSKVPASHFGYLRKAQQMQLVFQDQNDATKETYYAVIRGADAAGQPDITPAGLLFQQGPFTISGAGAGAVAAWTVTITFPAAQTLPAGDFFFGVRIGVPGNGAGLWSTDGGSVHMSGGYPSPMVCGEHPRQGITPDVAWNVSYTGGVPASVLKTTMNRAWNITLMLDGAVPVLQPFAVDPKAACAAKQTGQANEKDLGYAGLWPDLIDREVYGYLADFGWRVVQTNAGNGAAFVFLSSAQLPLAMNVGFGMWYLNPADPFFALGGLPVPLTAAGEGFTAALNAPTEVRVALVGTYLYAQGAVVVVTPALSVQLTNWSGISF